MLDNNNNDWIDPHIRLVLSRKYKMNENEITKSFLSNLEELDLSSENISNLKGIQFAKKIKCLILNKNNIKNANQLKSLTNLTDLDLSENKIEDAHFLIQMKKIKNVTLESNNISGLPDLSHLLDLESINISNNKISNLCFLDNLSSKNIKIIATDQIILLKPLLVYYNTDYTFTPQLFWNKDTIVCYDNIQISGEYDILETNERPSMLFSISKLIIKKIKSDCIIKADFYHEIFFPEAGIFSGIVIQQLILKSNKEKFSKQKLQVNKKSGIVYGGLKLQETVLENSHKNGLNVVSNKVISLIDCKGNALHRRTNVKGEFEFDNVSCGRYTLLFPFIAGYMYLSPSLYVLNLSNDDCIEIYSTILIE